MKRARAAANQTAVGHRHRPQHGQPLRLRSRQRSRAGVQPRGKLHHELWLARLWQRTVLRAPRALAVNSSGTIYVADTAQSGDPGMGSRLNRPRSPATSPTTKPAKSPRSVNQTPWRSIRAPRTSGWPKAPRTECSSSTRTRKYLRQFGQAGTGSRASSGDRRHRGQHSSGDVYVIDTGNDRIQEFSKEGRYITQFLGAGSATAIADRLRRHEGNVWCRCMGPLSGAQIAKFSPAGTSVSQFGSLGSDPGSWARLRPGDLWRGHLRGRTGQECRSSPRRKIGEFIGQFDENGSGSGKSNLPWGIATDPTTGNLYVSEVGNDRVQEFSPSGSFITSFGNRPGGRGGNHGTSLRLRPQTAGQEWGPVKRCPARANGTGGLSVADTDNAGVFRNYGGLDRFT